MMKFPQASKPLSELCKERSFDISIQTVLAVVRKKLQNIRGWKTQTGQDPTTTYFHLMTLTYYQFITTQ